MWFIVVLLPKREPTLFDPSNNLTMLAKTIYIGKTYAALSWHQNNQFTSIQTLSVEATQKCQQYRNNKYRREPPALSPRNKYTLMAMANIYINFNFGLVYTLKIELVDPSAFTWYRRIAEYYRSKSAIFNLRNKYSDVKPNMHITSLALSMKSK